MTLYGLNQVEEPITKHRVILFLTIADVAVFTLQTTNLIRKYISWLDIPWSCLVQKFPTVFVCSPSQFLIGLVSMYSYLLSACYVPVSFEDSGHVAYGSSKVVFGHLTYVRIQRWDRGSGPPPPPPKKKEKKKKRKSFMVSSQYWTRSPEKHKATKPVFNVGR